MSTDKAVLIAILTAYKHTVVTRPVEYTSEEKAKKALAVQRDWRKLHQVRGYSTEVSGG